MIRRFALLFPAALALAACAHQPAAVTVAALRETPPVGFEGDAADDPAIWVAPDPLLSRVIGTQKKGGLFVYDLNGAMVQEIPGGLPNNIDLRDNYPWTDGPAPVLAASDREDNSITLWRLDPKTGLLESKPRARIATGFAEVYGVCLGRQGADFVAVATSKVGDVAFWRVSGGTTPTGAKLGGFTLGTITEGCVIDDQHGQLYAAEELKGIWRIALSDTSGAGRTLIDAIARRGAPPSGASLVADIEGLALWNDGDAGFLVASVQGQSRYAIYDRAPPNAYRGSFRIGASLDGRADAVSGTDGIEVLSAPLGADFPRGLFVAQDDENTAPNATQNFKYVSWADVEKALGLNPQ